MCTSLLSRLPCVGLRVDFLQRRAMDAIVLEDRDGSLDGSLLLYMGVTKVFINFANDMFSNIHSCGVVSLLRSSNYSVGRAHIVSFLAIKMAQ